MLRVCATGLYGQTRRTVGRRGWRRSSAQQQQQQHVRNSVLACKARAQKGSRVLAPMLAESDTNDPQARYRRVEIGRRIAVRAVHVVRDREKHTQTQKIHT